MKAKKKAWIVIIVLAVIGFCVGFYFEFKGKKDKQEQKNTDKDAGKRNTGTGRDEGRRTGRLYKK